jgi:hypothetical protein
MQRMRRLRASISHNDSVRYLTQTTKCLGFDDFENRNAQLGQTIRSVGRRCVSRRRQVHRQEPDRRQWTDTEIQQSLFVFVSCEFECADFDQHNTENDDERTPNEL